ncbi:MAG: histidine kinase [Betaproteobacteria bacterium HGW-Betaproteobacteria-1]|jgi:signal transduction histidine kinase|nr:MAG: histidine kinase [Betaproteobacteria bacterium HGW-Betaproteobacteria-1]
MAKFDVAARTLIHLGSELITSDEIAIHELIKNSFDAGSPRVSVKFMVLFSIELIDKCKKLLLVANPIKNPIEETIDLINLEVAPELSGPAKQYLDSLLDQLVRSQTNNNAIQIIESANYIEVADSGSGMSRELLDEVFLRIGTDYKVKNISGPMKDRVILGNKGIGRLAMMKLGYCAYVETWVVGKKTSESISFDWREFEDPNKSISDVEFPISTQPKPASSESGTLIKAFNLKSDWNEARIRDVIINKFLRRMRSPFSEVNSPFPIDVHFNGGSRIPIQALNPDLIKLADRTLSFEFFPNKIHYLNDPVLRVVISNEKNQFADTPFERNLAEVSHKLNASVDDIKKLGPLKLNIHWFNRANLNQSGLKDDLSRMRTELDVWNGGVAIYRDGFRVGLSGSEDDGDWLKLDQTALKKGGFIVNRIQTIGALEITKKDNPNLMDRSNREGLIETRETHILRELLIEFAINALKENVIIENELQKKAQLAEFVSDGTGTIENQLKEASHNLSLIREQASPELKTSVNSLGENLHFITSQVKKYSNAILELTEKREDILELAGVGTVMHSVLHELTRTTAQTRDLLSQVAKTADDSTKDLLEKLEAEIKAINTRLRQLDPLTPSGRQRRDEFDIVKLTNTILKGYQSRFNRHCIDINFTVEGEKPKDPVMVKMVKGFYSLAIENLLTNSVYWLKTKVNYGERDRIINIDIDPVAKVLSLSDNGPGIAPNDKERIFNPGFSLRKNGNGFGLYIAREVAKHHGANLGLDEALGSDGRHRTFMLELPRD